jgi:hypothetical protein
MQRGFVKVMTALGGVTIGYDVAEADYPIGQPCQVVVWGYAITPKAISAVVALPRGVPVAANTLPHITLAYPPRSAPVQGKHAAIRGAIVLTEPFILEGKIVFFPFKTKK